MGREGNERADGLAKEVFATKTTTRTRPWISNHTLEALTQARRAEANQDHNAKQPTRQNGPQGRIGLNGFTTAFRNNGMMKHRDSGRQYARKKGVSKEGFPCQKESPSRGRTACAVV